VCSVVIAGALVCPSGLLSHRWQQGLRSYRQGLALQGSLSKHRSLVMTVTTTGLVPDIVVGNRPQLLHDHCQIFERMHGVRRQHLAARSATSFVLLSLALRQRCGRLRCATAGCQPSAEGC
jgi:hypothetical protein